MRRVVLLLLGLTAASGCGAVLTTGHIIQGSMALASAKSADAELLATYDYVSAQEYLAKAKESHSEADYGHSLRFARIAVAKAQRARSKALAARKVDLPAAESAEPAPPHPAPAPSPPPAATPEAAPAGRPPIIIRKIPQDAAPAPETR